MFDKKGLIDYLNSLSESLKWWDNNIGASIDKKLKRLIRFRTKYLLYGLSKILPINFSSKTFFGRKIFYNLPENFRFLFFGLMPDSAEIRLTKFIIKNLESDWKFFDIGANCGFYTLLTASFINKDGEVHAFEPSPETFRLLEKTAKDLPNVFLNQLAVSKCAGTIDFYVFPKSPTMNSPVSNSEGGSNKITVGAVSLDEYCREKSVSPNFIKIDVEGYEEYVLQGAKEILTSSDIVVSMEMFKNSEKHLSAAERLLDYGYKSYLIKDDGEIGLISPNTVENINNIIPDNIFFDNLIFRK